MSLALGDLNLIVVLISIIQHTAFIAYTFNASRRVLFCLMRTFNKVETNSFGYSFYYVQFCSLFCGIVYYKIVFDIKKLCLITITSISNQNADHHLSFICSRCVDYKLCLPGTRLAFPVSRSRPIFAAQSPYRMVLNNTSF